MDRVAKARLWGTGIALGMALVSTLLIARAVNSWITPGDRVYSLNSKGIKDGPCVAYHRGNKLKAIEGQYVEGERHGLFTHWREDGRVRMQVKHERDRLEPVDARMTPPWWNSVEDQKPRKTAIAVWAQITSSVLMALLGGALFLGSKGLARFWHNIRPLKN